MDLLYSLADTITRFMNDGPGFVATLLYLAVAGFPVTLVHEFGHALVAVQRLGSEVEVTVGTGAKVAQFRLGQVTARLHALSDPGRVSGSASIDDDAGTSRRSRSTTNLPLQTEERKTFPHHTNKGPTPTSLRRPISYEAGESGPVSPRSSRTSPYG